MVGAMACQPSKALAACEKERPHRPVGQDCDKYPLRTTDEGAGKGDGPFSVRDIDPFQNQTAGSFLSRYLD